MHFFLSNEGSAPGCTFLNPLMLEFEKRLQILKGKDFGEELTNISIISVIMSDEYIDGYPERKLFQRKQKSADIRLHIDFNKFVHSKPESRREMYIQHILDSIDTLRNKVSKDYRFDELYNDVKNILTADDTTTKV